MAAPVTATERNAVIEECIQAVLSVRQGEPNDADDRAEWVEAITGAACFRLLRLKTTTEERDA